MKLTEFNFKTLVKILNETTIGKLNELMILWFNSNRKHPSYEHNFKIFEEKIDSRFNARWKTLLDLYGIEVDHEK